MEDVERSKPAQSVRRTRPQAPSAGRTARNHAAPQRAPLSHEEMNALPSHLDDHGVLPVFGLVGEVWLLCASVPNQHLENKQKKKSWRSYDHRCVP